MTRAWRFVTLVRLASLALACGITAAAAQAPVLRGENGESIRALVIGIDAYQKVRPLKGAIADARDTETALRKMGVTDIVVLVDEQASRARILNSIEEMAQRIRPGDLVVLSIAGHGTQEPETVKGSQPDGMDTVFLLAGFEPTAAGSQQRILGREFNHFIKKFEARGARVLFVADTCHGGGLTREVDPRASELSYRQVPRYVLTVDELKPVGNTNDAYLTELDFERTVFLAAADRKTKSPEVRIPGVNGFRGALSYAAARALEGEADGNKDRKTTLQELFTHVRSVVYQLSDQRQNPVTVASSNQRIESDVVFALDSGSEPPKPGTGGAKLMVAAAQPRPPSTNVVRIAALNAQGNVLAGLEQRETPFEVVASAANADLVWDAKSQDVLANGDVIAYRMDKGDLPSIIDRSAAVLGIKRLAAKTPQVINVGPDDKIHRDHKKVVVDIVGVGGRALVLFNIASDGTVQVLYPIQSDPPLVMNSNYRLPVVVRSPFGADQIVAVTSEQRMLSLEQALQRLNQRRTAMQAMRMVERYAPRDARIGTVGLFTAP